MAKTRHAMRQLPAIERSVRLPASQARVWRALTEPDLLAQWFPQKADWELRPGGTGEFHWDGVGTLPIRVEEVEPPTMVAWSWGMEAESDPASSHVVTRVEWSLQPAEEGATVLHLRETGFRDPDHRAENEQGWFEELAQLEQLFARETSDN